MNYTPLYFTINGVAFSKANAPASLFPTTPGTTATPVSGAVLVRMVNAGLRMHVPSIVGSTTGTSLTSGIALVAEDGNPVPFVPHVQSEVFMAAGKTFDVMINVPQSGSTALPIYDRELSLSGNKIDRDAGMLAYIGVNGAGIPAAAGVCAAIARPDTYLGLLAGKPFTVSDSSIGVLANDTNVYGAQILTQAVNGVVTLNPDGTFTYTPNAGSTATADSFSYEGNGSPAVTATVTLGPAAVEAVTGITVPNTSFISNMATFIEIPNPGVLTGAVDAAGYPLSLSASTITPSAGLTIVSSDPAGGFVASVASPGAYTFTFHAQNAQGTLSNTATATITFPTGSGLAVSLVDGKTGAVASNGDYRWIIEEDRSFYINPNCTTNSGTAPVPPACAGTASPAEPFPFWAPTSIPATCRLWRRAARDRCRANPARLFLA